MKRIIVLIVFISVNFFSERYVYPEIKVKIRDITYVDGLKENQVFGFGLVVGLQGTGDTKAAITSFSMKNLLKNLGLEHSDDFNSKNIASVIITAKLPPFARVGDRVDVTISSIGDAKSLEGGILIQSPLRGADEKIYIVAQGPLSVGKADRRGRGVKTVAHIANGGIVERGIFPEFVINNRMNLVLKKWDFSMADQIVKQIAGKYPESKPSIIKGGKIGITIPKGKDIIELLSDIEKIEITPSYTAKVIINEKDGTIVMGGDVKISEVLVSREGITVKVEEGDKVSSVAHLKETSTVKDLIDALHHIGASTGDIISIVKALKDAGALHADLIIK
jgi:flagellar P-ring protein precursor FlgI